MNDRFKFRVWNKPGNSYISAKYDADFVYLEEEGNITVGLYNGDLEDMMCLKEEDLIIEQCTGLKDKNGLLIYEGDIVLFKSAFDKEESFAEIKFGKADGYECFYPKWHGEYIEETKYNPGWRKDIHYWIEHQIEVVGNIHENPELLEAQK